MEAVILRSSSDQTISPFKQQQNRNSIKNIHPFISQPFDNFGCSFPSNLHAGFSYAAPPPPPPFISHSFPPPLSVLNSPQLQAHHQQPPLLPLPFPKPINSVNSLPSGSRGISCPPINKRVSNKSRNQSLTPPKKSKPKKEESSKKGSFKSATNKTTTTTTLASNCFIIESTNPLGPEPEDLPKDVSKVLCSSTGNVNAMDDELGKFSGSVVFTPSPPPSSLPLPTFFLRPKLSCNAEAGGIDAGATDDLRRLLRL